MNEAFKGGSFTLTVSLAGSYEYDIALELIHGLIKDMGDSIYLQAHDKTVARSLCMQVAPSQIFFETLINEVADIFPYLIKLSVSSVGDPEQHFNMFWTQDEGTCFYDAATFTSSSEGPTF